MKANYMNVAERENNGRVRFKYTTSNYMQFIMCVANGMDATKKEIVQASGMPYAAAFEWSRKNKDYRKMWDDAKEKAHVDNKREIYHRMVGKDIGREYVQQEIDTDGRFKIGWTGVPSNKRFEYYADNSHDCKLLYELGNRKNADHKKLKRYLDKLGLNVRNEKDGKLHNKGEWYRAEALPIIQKYIESNGALP